VPQEAQEEELRQLQAEIAGIDSRHCLDFAGQTWRLREAGDLVGLLRYATLMSVSDIDDGEHSSQVFAAAHRVLSECIHPAAWPQFERSAITTKVGSGDIRDAIRRIFEVLTARPFPAAVKLLGYAAADIGWLDGFLLLSHGSGLSSMTARQVCNVVFARLVEGMEEDLRAEWTEDLNAEEDPKQRALSLAQEMIKNKPPASEPAPPPVETPLQPGPDYSIDWSS